MMFNTYLCIELCGGLVVSMLDCESRSSGFPAIAEIWFKISAPPVPIANSAMMSTLTVHCQ